MRLYNGTVDDFTKQIGQRKIVLYGAGSYFRDYVSDGFPKEWLGYVDYVIDSSKHGNMVSIREKKIPVYNVEKVKEETDCVIMLTSSTVMYEMYEQLESMRLGEDVICCAYPLILAKTTGKSSLDLENIIFTNKGVDRIQKVIHSFWFSGEKKTTEYQKCIDSWKKVCPDYEIKEWNLDNYDYSKNCFMEQAVRHKKWAFASDVARLDVIYRQGGIYMDMDVELFKPLDKLLKNQAFFSFETHNDIDLTIFGAVSGNELIERLLRLYENIDFDGTLDMMNQFCQPVYIRDTMRAYGVNQTGDMQYINGMAFLPRCFFAPKDQFIYELDVMNEKTMAAHHCNSEWKDRDYKEKKKNSARRLWDLMEKNARSFGYGTKNKRIFGNAWSPR